MASERSGLNVTLSPDAEADLLEIWADNADFYQDVAHADAYVGFLLAGIEALAQGYRSGRPLEGYPEYRFVILRKRPRGHGHYVIYSFDSQAVTVLRVFHTRMDIAGRLRNQFGTG